ncbi:putative bifunctional diguanylate cyclase/phosphodiesterase [Sphingorhabdus sp.]|jgi:cyclic di-GMP phosphodiesterase Gmr|uniref:putative bifunctional diguanylate cyclase/phosphodiesterase n=3 Tax=Sphingorhabdus sp. TaxID=1902408 RepID=UPI003BAFA733|nr:bifunctional diguanylate cyclase/phosphodiesterase [Sphingomonadales bacterium]MBK9431967.1 bifunctional diguanylate cyclase/phosphodiesterase [Sphingomonadales bacterium]MBL0022313.1 bifunctional diguanylate cyclase/phosphodiesterase [Sphingomonadales bacterium]
MHNWGRNHFDTNEAASLTARMVVRSRPEGSDSEFGWLSALPIAAAIFQVNDNEATRVASNDQFSQIAFAKGREAGLDLSEFSGRIFDMRQAGRALHYEKWASQNAVSRCEIEVSIAQFGKAHDLYMLCFVDRTAEAVSRINLRREMLNDNLTGFSNRVGFEEKVDEMAETVLCKANGERDAGQFAMIVIDLTRFSRINESMGVLVGDELILAVAHRLNSRVRQHEILARVGGDEFALFASVKNEDQVRAIASRLEQAFADPCKLSDVEIKVECAIAAAIGEYGRDEPMDSLRHAQLTLKKAKRTRCLELFSADKLVQAKQRFSIETDLRHALAADQLELHYQPLIDLGSGKLTGFEALARWNHPQLGYISPVDFIPVAEESGLIIPLGRWALAEAARTISHWDDRAGKQLPFRISVNLSAEQLARDDVTAAVKSAINGAGISGDRLILELTESALVEDPDGARAKLEALKNLDASLAMDDFGTGYSNLSYLQKLPIDVLKIDRSFITDMLANQDSRAIVSTILSLANALGMKTTAEGIETEELSDALKGLGCTNGQGYFYARPLANDAAYAFLADCNALATS